MSVQATSWVWDKSSAEGTVRLVALAVADGANAQGRGSCQSVGTIARMCKISERSVQRALRWLEDAGELVAVGQSRRYRTMVYDFACVAPEGDTQGNEGDSQGDLWVTPRALEGDTGVTQSHLSQTATPKKSAAAKPPPPGAGAAKRLYDGTEGALRFIATQQIATWAMGAKGATEDRVVEVGLALYAAGKPITRQTVGQALDGVLKLNGSARTTPTNSDHWQQGGGFR